MVLHDQHTASVQRSRAVGPLAPGRRLRYVLRDIQFQMQPDLRTLPLLAPNVEAAAHFIDDALGDRKPEPRAAAPDASGGVLLHEGFKETRLELFAHADAVIPDYIITANTSAAYVSLGHPVLHPSARGGEFYGVREKIEEYLVDAHLVHPYRRGGPVAVKYELYALAPAQRLYHRLYRARKLFVFITRRVQQKLAAFYLRHIEDVVDEGKHKAAG